MIAIVCLAIGVLSAIIFGYASAVKMVQQAVFTPWLESITPGAADFGPRMNDYSKAWDRFVDAALILRPWRRSLRSPTEAQS